VLFAACFCISTTLVAYPLQQCVERRARIPSTYDPVVCCSCPNSASHRNPPSAIRKGRLQILTFQSVDPKEGPGHLASFGVMSTWPSSEKVSSPVYSTQTLQPSGQISISTEYPRKRLLCGEPSMKATTVYNRLRRTPRQCSMVL
jgi:hypothetical protein